MFPRWTCGSPTAPGRATRSAAAWPPGIARGLSARESVGLGAAVAGTAITGSGSLRLLQSGHDRAAIAAAGRSLAAASNRHPVPCRGHGHGLPGRAAAVQGDDPRYDIDVMRREIMTIPDVVSDVLDDAEGRITALAKRLAARGIRHLWLTGCGDSAFAGQAAELAFLRHSPIAAHPIHALDLARYQVRQLPSGSAVIAASFSGKAGRTIEAAVQAQAGRSSRRRADQRAVERPGPGIWGNIAARRADARLLTRDVQLRGDGVHPAAARRRARPAGRRAGADRRARAGCPARSRRRCARRPTPPAAAARSLLPAPWIAFLGAGPNEATARFGAAKLIEGAQLLGVATNLEEWAHEQYFVTSAGDPVVLINPSGAGYDRGLEILSELAVHRGAAQS